MRHIQKSQLKEFSYDIHLSWYDLIFQIAEDHQIDISQIIEPQKLTQRHSDIRRLRDILYRVVEASGDNLLPIKAAKNLHALSFGVLSLVLWTSPNLYSLMKTCCEYGVLFGTPIRLLFKETAEGNGEFWLIDNEPYNHQSVVTHVGLLLFISTLIQIILKTTTEPDIQLTIHFANNEISSVTQQEIKETLNCQIYFDAPITKITVPRKYLFSALRNTNNEINNINHTLLRKEVATIASSNIIIQSYRVFDEAQNLTDISGEKLARELNMSVRTLNRRLREANISYRGLIDKYKLEKAIYLLHNPNISMTEISYRLGFSDLSTFSRAFKRWTGACPSKIKL
ncbi:helix-turn-helix domain-containing protein [Aliivibrio fischeri]|uniref:helix-turn-helix domain-containing protein n=1 Tax=Aliivibrio fischeri TaxID=668 RepID=UPI0012D86DC8|nr:helix-turn-helix domain-containing protein [Aliivibrio fischeri]MUK26499.1 helix-turn-helix domain-containing protein [Aliivibrio fischeri]MUK33739.1 helix-turn-helix domain-containing protein [Aliivibrio fischeri]